MKNQSSQKFRIISVGAAFVALCCGVAGAKLSGSLTEEAISERLQPFASVEVDGKAAADAQPAQAAWGPEVIYKKNCSMCHSIGLAGAPKTRNKSDWAPRVAQGMATLLKHSIEGYKAMPPKGNCLKCTEEDIKQTIEYMLPK